MKMKSKYFLFVFLFFFLYQNLHTSQAQPSIDGHKCTASNQTNNTAGAAVGTYPCQTYVLYRAKSPNFLDLASIGDLFSMSRLTIANPSNISTVNSTLAQDQPLLVPINCSCNFINSSFGSISYAGLNYAFKPGDSFWKVSTEYFQNLTTYQSVEVVNPTKIPTQIEIGEVIRFPIFCKCPNQAQLRNQVRYLISYVFQPSDNLSSIASRFNTTVQDIIDVNGNNSTVSDTIFIPVSRLPRLSQISTNVSAPPPASPASPVAPTEDDRKGEVIGLGIGLGICGLLLILVCGLWIHSRSNLKRRRMEFKDVEKQYQQQQRQYYDNRGGEKTVMMKDGAEASLLADVADYLDKYKVFGIEELKEATDDFDESLVIQGSVYKGTIGGELYAIKKMKWNAYEELKILQMVNHGNLVKLEGFCIDQDEANCYLVYEYIENGSLHSWLHEKNKKKETLSWKTRLRIAIDIANGLQYIHEHTRPRVVHKDIKSSNILLDSNMRAKIANFGLAKSGCNAITMHIVGTQGYIAPEYLSDGVVSTKMDVFSFGVVLLELISGREAIDESGKVLWAKVNAILEGEDEEEKVKRLKSWMDDCLLKEIVSMEGVMNVMTMAVACVQKDPSKRPTMVEIVYALCKSDDILFDVSEDGLSPRPQVVAR